MRAARTLAAVCLAWLVLGLASIVAAAEPALLKKTALDDYIAKPDPAYAWKLLKTSKGTGYTTYIVDLKSQSWRQPPEVDRSVWQHWLVVVKPDEAKSETGMLLLGGGKNGGEPPAGPSAQLVLTAMATHSVVAELRMIPNQPLTIGGDGKPRTEDDLIAHCWVKYLDTGDPTWLPRLPMVKSAVRAMDTITALLASDEGGKMTLNKFVITGGSKRGWTTWLVGAVDPRVRAIIPLVIDVVNVRACSEHHFCAYGFWAPALGNYTEHDLFARHESPRYAELLRIVDPYFYWHRLTTPKYLVNAGGDQYFPPDSSRFYFDELEGPKYLRYVPNTDHSLRNSDAVESVVAFYRAILKGSELPKLAWKLRDDGSLRVTTDTKPRQVLLWQANNPKARDFRLETLGPAYKQTTLTAEADGSYMAKVAKPAEGWTAFFVELTFDSGEKMSYKFTTQVYVTPDTLPHSLEEARRKK